MKFSFYSPGTVLAIFAFLSLGVLIDVTLLQFLTLRSYELVLDMQPLEQIRVDFFEKHGNWASSRESLYALFLIPPVAGFTVGIALRGHVRKILIRNEEHFRKEIRRLAKWVGVDSKGLQEDLPLIPQFLPLLIVLVFLFVIQFFIFPGTSSLVLAFLATCGFANFGTWKRIYTDALARDEVHDMSVHVLGSN